MKKIFIIFFIILAFIRLSFANTLYEDKIDDFLDWYTANLFILHKLETELETRLAGDYNVEQLNIILYFKTQTQKKISQIQEIESYTPKPSSVKALYYSAYATSRESKIDDIIDIAKDTEVNALIIDIKEIDGKTSFSFNNDDFWDIKPVSNNRISDISSILTKLKENNIYAIGRIVVFKDNYLPYQHPELAIKWSWDHNKIWWDYKWNSYSDPGSQQVWDYHIEMASAAYEMWFDEINFDYVRFPSDGYISQTYYPLSTNTFWDNPEWWKMIIIDQFSEYINRKLKIIHPDIITSADVFGLVTNTNLFQIGQNLESFVLYFDYVAPMIYPSHYASGYLWQSVPDNAPYEIFFDAMSSAQTKIDTLNEKIITSQSWTGELLIQSAFPTSADKNSLKKVDYNKIRPWLQWFSCSWCSGATEYTSYKFRRQIQAIEDLWFSSGWYVWNASAHYYKGWYK